MNVMRHNKLLPIAVALALSATGFVALFKIFKVFSPQEMAEVTLHITLRAKNRPISHAEIWLIRPEHRLLGITRPDGKALIQTHLKKGKIAVIEAQGATFRISKDLPIPNLDRYEMQVMLDETELNLGRITLESRSRDAKEKSAIATFKENIGRIEEKEAAQQATKVTVSLAENQPQISASAQSFLAKARKAFQAEANRKKYTLQKKQINSIVLRMLKNQSLFLEVLLLDAKKNLRGAKLVPVQQVNGKTVPTILADAEHWQYDNGTWPQNSQSLNTRFWHIRKRPVDTIRTYLNGEPLVSRENNDITTALLPNAYAPDEKWQLAAVGQSGLVVIKELEASKVQRPLVWRWPEWLTSQRSEALTLATQPSP